MDIDQMDYANVYLNETTGECGYTDDHHGQHGETIVAPGGFVQWYQQYHGLSLDWAVRTWWKAQEK